MTTLANEILSGTDAGVMAMINNGANVNDIDEYGFNPLIEAVIAEKLTIVKLLINHGAEVDGRDILGRTPLHWAVDNNNFEIAKFLLENKADPNAHNQAGQPIFSIPLLRGKENIKELLYQYGAELTFAQDFINAKLIGHRYEIEGQIHLFNTKGRFIIIELEGFYLEATVSIVLDSFKRFRNNYAAKNLQTYFSKFNQIVRALDLAEELLRLQNYYNKLEENRPVFYNLLEHPLLLIPVAYQGHAITCIRYGKYWIKCDRGFNSRTEGSVVVYEIGKPDLITKPFLFDLMVKSHSKEFVNIGINDYLQLFKIAEMPLPAQVIGNCSWANVEASVPAMLFLLLLSEEPQVSTLIIHEHIRTVTKIFDEWREWDKDRAIEECVQSFNFASRARKAAKAELLAAVLVEKCRYNVNRELKRAEKILPLITQPDYRFALETYIKLYVEEEKTALGDNLMHLLDLAGSGDWVAQMHAQGE